MNQTPEFSDSNQSLIKPMEHLPNLPTQLNGQRGSNRNSDDNVLIDAIDDLQAIAIWLRRYDQSAQTFRSYRKEIERLYLWSIQTLNKEFSSLTVDDINSYLKFLRNPSPKSYWCGPRRPRNHPNWKPFEDRLNEASCKQSLSIIGACFNFLVACGYLKGNPVKLLSRSSQPKPYRSATVERYLEQPLWQFFWNYISQPRFDNLKQQRHYERNLFIFSLLYLQSPRASEAVLHNMSTIVKQRDKWWWLITGKGNKTRKIPWKDETMQALCRYRKFRGLSPYPSPQDNAPIIATLTGEKPITADMLYKTVKQVVQEVANELALTDNDSANRLRQASTHWFRHTSLTHLADDGVDLRYLQAQARHESMKTTQRYLHIGEDDFHRVINEANNSTDE